MEMRHHQLSLLVSLLCCAPQVWAAPSNTMSVTPACTSGTTILCSDETTRNNNISTPYNSHTHTDIAAMTGVNTFTIGDNAAGNKDYCEDGATDRCIRYNSTVDLWTIQQGGATYNQIVTFTGTAGVSAGQVLVANGTGSIVGITSGVSGTLLRSAGAGVNPGWTTPTFPNTAPTNGQLMIGDGTNYVLGTLTAGSGVTVTNGAGSITVAALKRSTAVSFTRTAAQGSGAVSITGVGFTPISVWMMCVNNTASNAFSISFSDSARTAMLISMIAGNVSRNTAQLIDVESGADNMSATSISSYDSDGFSFTWSKGGAGLQANCVAIAER